MLDLGSDTVTMPTDEMREAMLRAELGDDSRQGDPTVRRLENLAAERTGKQDAIFVASGTMSNLVALLAHTGRGGEVLLDAESHFMRSEMGGIAALAGLFYRPLAAKRGALDLSELREKMNEKLTRNRLATALVCMETTHNSAGGAVLSLEYMAKVRALAAEKHIPVHIDGARLFNAAVALGVPASEIAQYGDSVGFCVSKGLSAPFGSVLCGPADFIERCRAYRRMVGGGMRQAGIMASAGIVALDTMVARLADDHRRAKMLAEGIQAIDPRFCEASLVETNIVMMSVGHLGTPAADWIAALSAKGLKAGEWSPRSLRFVTHRHIDDAAIRQAVTTIRAVSDALGNGKQMDSGRAA